MYSQNQQSGTTEVTRKGSKLLKLGFNLLVILLVFYLGIEVGNGHLSINSNKTENGKLPPNLDYSSVEQVYDSLKSNYDGQLDVNKLLAGAKEGLANATGDPYTEFFDAASAQKFHEQLSGSFQGIGAQLGKDSNGNLIIIAPIANTPADKAGLKPKDVITEINGTNTTNMPIDEAVSRIRGTAGTKVTLKIVRDQSQTLSITITRADIKVPSVTSKILPGNIGYLQISQFSDDTAGLASKAAQSFKDAKVKGIVLDMRSDPGGLLDAAISVSSLWVPSGKTVLTERRGTQIVQTYTATGDDTLNGIPTAVLIDDGSASASEITAGALHDNGVAKLIGVTSFGKGSVQQLICFDGSRASNGDCLGDMLKVTIARWYTPDGKNIDKQGIKPDQVVQRTDDQIKAGVDPQLDAATAYLNK